MDSVLLDSRSPAAFSSQQEVVAEKQIPLRKSSVNKQEEIIVWDDPPSSPFQTEVADGRIPSGHWKADHVDAEIEAIFDDPEMQRDAQMQIDAYSSLMDDEKENAQPTQSVERKSTPIKPNPTSQTKPTPSQPPQEIDLHAMPPPSTTKRPSFTTKKSSSSVIRSAATTPLPPSRTQSYENSVQSTVKRAANRSYEEQSQGQDETNIDDTCFSTFSAVPELTLFARLGESDNATSRSPLKDSAATPRQSDQATPRTSRKRQSTSRSPSPTPRRQRSPTKDGNTTSLLIDFTQQFESVSSHDRLVPARSGGLSPSRTEPNLLSYINNQRSPTKGRASGATPSRQSNLLNLLDFELPPPPTPRSAPAFTLREVESLKSSYLSQISSIKAKLSGKEAEVDSLKKALEDAERRVGESQESARTEKLKREQAEQDKADWEKRGLDVEIVLKNVKAEVHKSEAEKEALVRRTEESERRAEDAEARNLDLQARLASMPVAKGPNGEEVAPSVTGEEIQRLVQAQLDQKIESVSRELHSVYKKKHETKVATLKKSYEARSEKKCAELQAKVDELLRNIEELQLAKEATFSGEVPQSSISQQEYQELRHSAEKHRAEIEEQSARLVGLNEELRAVKREQSRLMQELEQERLEKGELVAAVDEMLLLQATDGAPAAIEDFKKSISRPSGLRAPGGGYGSGESRIGRAPLGLPRNNSKSKMMSNIERMGMGNGRNFD